MTARALPLVLLAAAAAHDADACATWFDTTRHGWSWRNVTAFGAVGDGVHDDTAAIQAAIDYQRGGDAGSSADKSAAFVYLPPGTYRISDTLVLWKWTTLQGNTACPPTLRVAAGTPAFGGAAGLRPVLVTNGGFNSTAAEHAWWLESDSVGGATNVYFFSSVRSLALVIEAGNPGAVGLTWNVAQQTSLRNVTITAAPDAAVGLDVGASAEYEHWIAGVPYNLGGGGTVEDVTVVGARVGVRVAATQFALRGLTVRGSSVACVLLWQLTWSVTLLQLAVADCPVGARLEGVQGTVAFLDASFANISGPSAIATDGAGAPLLLQAVTVAGPPGGVPPHVVDDALPTTPAAATLVPLWATGAAYGARGRVLQPAGAPGGPLPLPSLQDAAAAGVPLACTGAGGAPHLCGGSAVDASTGVPRRPRPTFGELGARVLNALDFGAVGDGATDDTAALRAALAALPGAGPRAALFLPFGIYVVSDTLVLPRSGRLVGEGLSVLLLAPNASGFGPPPPGGAFKPLLLVDGGGDDAAELADVAVWSTGCGNEGAALLAWGAGPDSGAWDVNMLLSATVGAKAAFVGGGGGGGGGGYFANTWWCATTAYDPAAAQAHPVHGALRSARAAIAASKASRASVAAAGAAVAAPAGAPDHAALAAAAASAVDAWRARAAPLLAPVIASSAAARRVAAGGAAGGESASTCAYTPLGVLVATSGGGPLFWVGANLEHAVDVELSLLPGATNVLVVNLETEEAAVGLSINATRNAVVFSALHAFWNVSLAVPAQVLLRQGAAAPPPAAWDLSYRLLGVGVPLPASEGALAADVTPDSGRAFSVPLGSGPGGFARAAAVLLQLQGPDGST